MLGQHSAQLRVGLALLRSRDQLDLPECHPGQHARNLMAELSRRNFHPDRQNQCPLLPRVCNAGLHNSALALPFSGAATSLTFRVPSANTRATSLAELLGVTFTRIVRISAPYARGSATPALSRDYKERFLGAHESRVTRLAPPAGAVSERTKQQRQMIPLGWIAHFKGNGDGRIKRIRHIRRHVEHDAIDALGRRLAKIQHPAVVAGTGPWPTSRRSHGR